MSLELNKITTLFLGCIITVLNCNMAHAQTILSRPLWSTHYAGKGALFSNNAERVLTWNRRGVSVWNASEAKVLHSEPFISSEPVSVKFSTTDNEYAMIFSDGSVVVRDTESGKLMFIYRSNIGKVQDVDFSNDGKSLLVGGIKIPGTILNAKNGDVIRVLNETSDVYSVDFSNDGRYVMTSGTAEPKIWNVETGALVLELKDKIVGAMNFRALFSSTDNAVVSYNQGGKITLWNTKNGSIIKTLAGGCSANVPLYAELSSDGDKVLTRCNGYIMLWSTKNGNFLYDIKADIEAIKTINFSKDAKLLITVHTDSSVKVWDSSNGLLKYAVKSPKGAINNAYLGKGNNYIVMTCSDTSSYLWNVETKTVQYRFRSSVPEGVSGAKFTGDDNKVIVTHYYGASVLDAISGNVTLNHQIQSLLLINESEAVADSLGKRLITKGRKVDVWDLTTNKLMYSIDSVYDAEHIAINPDGKTFVITREYKHYPLIWDIETGLKSNELKGTVSAVKAIAYDRDGKRIVTAGTQGVLKIWDANDGKLIKDINSQVCETPQVRFSYKGDKLVTGCDDEAQIWDIAKGKSFFTLKPYFTIESVMFSPNDEYILASDTYPSFQIWKAKDATLVLQPDYYASRARFHRSSKYIVATSKNDISTNQNGKAIIIEIETGKKVAMLEHPGINTAEFSNKGDKVVTSGYDGLIRLWDIGQLLVTDVEKEEINEEKQPLAIETNSANETITIRKDPSLSEKVNYIVLTSTGTIIEKGAIPEGINEFEMKTLQTLASGVYLIVVTSGHHTVSKKHLIIH